MPLSKLDLQSLADRRIADAKILIDNGRFDAGYYVAGYSVECALKACIAKAFVAEAIPEKKFVLAVYTHVFIELIELAGLKTTFKADTTANAALFGFWGTVQAWKEDSRYFGKDETAAREMYAAVTNSPDGVLLWIKRFW